MHDDLLRILQAHGLDVDGATLRDTSRRHRSAHARLPRGHGYHAKVAENGTRAALLAREASALRHLAAHARGLAPTLLLDERDTLVTRLVKDAAPFPRRPAWRGLGEALARLHATPWPDAPRAVLPLALAVPMPTVPLYHALSPAQKRLLALAQGDAPARDALDRLDRAWRGSTLIHGDVKPDNAVTRRGGKVVLTDLETAGAGPAAWDVGSALAAPLAAWVAAMPLAPGFGLEAAAERARPRLDAARRAARALLRGYGEWPAGTGAHAGARLVQSAFEDAARAHAPSPTSIVLLQLGVSILRAPSDVLHDLLEVDA